MPNFLITAPDGTKYNITGPEGSTESDALVQLQKQLGATPAAAAPESRSMGDVLTSAVTNIPSSAVEFGKNLVQPILHPIDTATSLKELGHGVLQKMGLASGDEHVQNADAVGKFLMNRYGSIEAIKNTLAEDPVGLAADLSMILTGGGSAAARLPGIAGKVGEVASAAGRVVDPLTAAGQVAKGTGWLASELTGVTTGAGGKSIRTAASAGREGGEAGQAFLDNFRGNAPLEEVVSDARAAVQQLRQERGVEYRSGMKDVGADTAVLDFSKIDAAVNRVAGVKNYKGQDLSPATKGVRAEITDAIAEWKKLDPAEFHTAEGLDALKQKLGSIRDGTEYGSPSRVVADGIYNAVRQTIVDQVPAYGKVMKGYEEASKIIKEIEGTLSTTPNARIDTSLRKLQSVLRDNVNTSYGHRDTLANYLVASGAPHLLEKLAGQSLSKWTPRGMGPLLALIAEGGGAGLLAHGLNPAALAAALGGATAASPKIVGGAAYGLGALSRPFQPQVRPFAGISQQIGRSAFAPQ